MEKKLSLPRGVLNLFVNPRFEIQNVPIKFEIVFYIRFWYSTPLTASLLAYDVHVPLFCYIILCSMTRCNLSLLKIWLPNLDHPKPQAKYYSIKFSLLAITQEGLASQTGCCNRFQAFFSTLTCWNAVFFQNVMVLLALILFFVTAAVCVDKHFMIHGLV